MKQLIRYILLAGLCIISYFPATAIAENNDASLRAIIEDIRVGWIEANGIPFRKHFLDYEGARYFEGGGQNVGLTDLIEHHVEPEADAFENFTLNFSNIETHIENGFAWALVDTEIKARIKKDGREIHNKGRGTYLFRNINGEWKVVHSNSASRPVKKEQHKH